jgi:drug/metabolite transporter (DMT)-like permease
MSQRRTHLDPAASLLLIALCASWGLTQVAIKVANAGISPVLQAGLRSVIAAALVWLWSALRGVRLFERDGTLWPGLAAAALFAAEFVFVYWGLAFTTAARGVLFLYTAPFFVALGAHVFIPGERLHGTKIVGLLAAFAGVAIAFADTLRLPSSRDLIGDAMITIGAILWAATTVVIKASRLAAAAPAKVLLYQLAGSAVMLLALSPLMGEAGITDPTLPVLLSLAYQGVVVAFVSYLTWFWLITRYPASTLHAFSFLTPLFGMIAGALLLHEAVTRGLALAMVLVAAGIYLVNRPRRAN